jgi:AraC family ethanolamine operon transcriptional activator
MNGRNSGTVNDGSGATWPAQDVAFCSFTDVEDQARSFDGWELVYTRLSGGPFQGSSSIVSVGAVRLLAERLNKTILQRGSVPAERLVVGVPLELEGHVRMCGEVSGPNSLHVFSSQPDFEFLSPEQHVLVKTA